MQSAMLSNFSTAKVEMSTEGMHLPTMPTSTSSSIFVGATVTEAVTMANNPSTTLNAGVATVTSTAKSDHPVYNATGYHVEHEEFDHSILAAFSDIQTVFLACISTLLPLVVALGIAFIVRHVWRKFRNRRNRDQRSHSGSIQPATRILSARDLVNGIDGPRYICELDVMEEASMATTPPVVEYASPGNHMSKNANGNIITLTLKNNHLIVETEERAVTMEENKTRKYPDNDCSFVVEVEPDFPNNSTDVGKSNGDNLNADITDQQALVHREEIPEDRSPRFESAQLSGSTNTGLSQSDLSISSQGSVNPSYRYGNQVEYDVGHLGYPMYGGSYESDTLSRKLEGASKWIEFDKSQDTEKTPLNRSKASSIEKDASESPSIVEKPQNADTSLRSASSSMDQQDSTDASNSTDTVRSNPNLHVNGTTSSKAETTDSKSLSGGKERREAESSKPVITGALLKDDAQEDTFQEQQRKLGNGTLTPEHRQDRPRKEQKPEGSAFVPCHKRTGSIPPRLIEEGLEIERKKPLDIYSQIKTSTKNILPNLSPKFEILRNEVSPIEEKES